MRLRTAVVIAATTVVGAGTAALAAGRYGSALALKPAVAGPMPGSLLRVRAVSRDEVVLDRGAASARPGVYGLAGIGVHATVGRVVDETAHSVTRRLLRTDKGRLAKDTYVRITPQVYTGDPGSALALEYEDVQVPGELGPMPAWLLPAPRGTWVIAVHGAGASRADTLNVVPTLHRFGLPVLVPAYRNDPGAPASPDHLGHLGDTEWHDLDAAMRYAVDQGAERIVLFGWSTGATMALRAAQQSPVRNRVVGLILDSPVLDWRSAVRAAVTQHRLPARLTPLAVRAVEGRTGLHSARHAEAADPTKLFAPTLLVHGPDDTFAPWDHSRALARRRPDVVTLHTVPGAPHAAMWNVDPDGYEETLRRFLTPLM
ncbi:alpha/beta hydrolase [Streptomyces sp. NBC_01190]|uniref:alpha/beta hydrolase n=1 Tax=Streptomyces sp. NBC_01190 TaxID=2903767 RepID=UPI00386590C3|nr:alpha/beta fold hydrolase [Streptomyces sp. NBC_01190]